MNTPLAKQRCTACEKKTPPLKRGEITSLRRQLGAGWMVVKGHHLEKQYKFDDFQEALAFTNRVGAIAEKEGHHPDVFLSWGKVRLELWTHNINGLSENDFILAAKADQAR